MRGFITEQHFADAEREFPGIRDLYLACNTDERPKTFLELVVRYLGAVTRAAKATVSSCPVPAKSQAA